MGKNKEANKEKEKKEVFLYVCEVCGKKEINMPENAYKRGWDYPPFMGTYGVISPRKCGKCSIVDTVYWALVVEKKEWKDLTIHQKRTINKIIQEPESMRI